MGHTSSKRSRHTGRPACAIVWFRRDLRLYDNAALRFALAHSDAVIPLFLDTSAAETPWAPGAASRWWLHQSIMSLAADLNKRGSRLILRRGDIAATLCAVARETNSTLVVWNRCYEPHWRNSDRRVEQALRAAGIENASFPGALLFEPQAIATKTGNAFRVFGPFQRAYTTFGEPAPPAPAPQQLPGPRRWPATDKLTAFELLPEIRWYADMARTWTPGERGARKRLNYFCRHGLANYATGRDQPAIDGVSRLSPHLHFGEVSPATVWYAVRAAGHRAGATTYVREIFWREFAYHVLHHFPHTTTKPLRGEFQRWKWRRGHQRLLRAWQRGQTGIPLIDAGMRELWQTGWMHNRLRMIVASLLTKNLNIDWRAGARWFWDTLVDADLANNTLGWQWTAGCGADAAPYFRIFNPVRQGERFDGDGRYVRHWVPELARMPDRYLHAPWRAPLTVLEAAGVVLGRDYPFPVVDLDESRKAALAAYRRLRTAR